MGIGIYTITPNGANHIRRPWQHGFHLVAISDMFARYDMPTLTFTQNKEITMFRIFLFICLLTGFTFANNPINISGQVTPLGSSLPLTQITVTATDLSSSNGTVSVGLSPFGYYTFFGLEGGNNYLIEPHAPKAVVIFSPLSRTLAGTQNWTGIDFTYSPGPACDPPCFLLARY